MSEQVTARDVESWVAEHLFGWTKKPVPSIPNFYEWYKPGRADAWTCDRLEPPHYTRDAYLDAEVRSKVRGMPWEDAKGVIYAVERLAACRSPSDLPLIAKTKTGDWATSAYAVRKGMDVLKLSQELGRE